MKIAAISITYNDWYKFNEWCKWYEEYKSEIYLFIIVDNGSEPNYISLVEKHFDDAIIIKRNTNGGCTSAYNDGIRRALEDKDVTHIALVGNDIRLKKGSLTKCVELLNSDNELGMAAPILLYADSNIVADYGDIVTGNLSLHEFGKGERLEDISEKWKYCEAVTGGMNVAKRSFYEKKVGLQDEKLFMYSDEADMALRARKAGVKMAVTKEALSWHQHINPPGNVMRHPFSNYLIARNKVYLGKKHFGRMKQFYIFVYFLTSALLSMLKNVLLLHFPQLIYPRWALYGALNGLIGNMKENKYSKL